VKTANAIDAYKSKLYAFIVEKTPDVSFILTEDLFLEKVFKHKTTLRLTYFGFKVLSRWYNNHKFNMKADINCKHFIAMCNRFSAPYYFNGNNLWLFGKFDAFESSFNNEDITVMLNRYCQWEERPKNE
jgi:hypothetical protein